MRLVLVRHGETQWNCLGKIQGRTDIPLNENGVKIAQITKQAYDRLGIRYDAVYTSPLQRAYQTAKILVPQNEIIIDERLTEFGFGIYEGYSFEKMKSEAKLNSNIYKCFFDSENYVADPTGETYEELLARINSFLDMLWKTYTGNERILIVCHGVTIRGFITVIRRSRINALWSTSHKNLCHSEIEWNRNKEFKIVDLEHYYYELTD